MPLVKRPLPRRALLAATLGALYGLLILPAPASVLGVSLPGIAWFVLSGSLLALTPLAYHLYSAWAALWVAYRAILLLQAGDALLLVIDLALPLASVALLLTSPYLRVARAWREEA